MASFMKIFSRSHTNRGGFRGGATGRSPPWSFGARPPPLDCFRPPPLEKKAFGRSYFSTKCCYFPNKMFLRTKQYLKCSHSLANCSYFPNKMFLFSNQIVLKNQGYLKMFLFFKQNVPVFQVFSLKKEQLIITIETLWCQKKCFASFARMELSLCREKYYQKIKK